MRKGKGVKLGEALPCFPLNSLFFLMKPIRFQVRSLWQKPKVQELEMERIGFSRNSDVKGGWIRAKPF